MTFQLTFEQANNIKHWRIDEECTFGRISELVWIHFPELRLQMERTGSISGRYLCEGAMQYFGEQIEDGWN
jgi:hypothetical protein